nr:MAG TPA: hypothetical protein [Caudoviricetes sp.]
MQKRRWFVKNQRLSLCSGPTFGPTLDFESQKAIAKSKKKRAGRLPSSSFPAPIFSCSIPNVFSEICLPLRFCIRKGLLVVLTIDDALQSLLVRAGLHIVAGKRSGLSFTVCSSTGIFLAHGLDVLRSDRRLARKDGVVILDGPAERFPVVQQSFACSLQLLQTFDCINLCLPVCGCLLLGFFLPQQEGQNLRLVGLHIGSIRRGIRLAHRGGAHLIAHAEGVRVLHKLLDAHVLVLHLSALLVLQRFPICRVKLAGRVNAAVISKTHDLLAITVDVAEHHGHGAIVLVPDLIAFVQYIKSFHRSFLPPFRASYYYAACRRRINRSGAGPSLDHPSGAVSQRHQEVKLFRPQLAASKQHTGSLTDSVANKSIGHSIASSRGLCRLLSSRSREADGVISIRLLCISSSIGSVHVAASLRHIGGDDVLFGGRLAIDQLTLCAVDAGHRVVVGNNVLAVAVLIQLGAAGVTIALKDNHLRGALDDFDNAQGLMVTSILVVISAADFKTLHHGKYLLKYINSCLHPLF